MFKYFTQIYNNDEAYTNRLDIQQKINPKYQPKFKFL